jgi:hypothetical protein
MNILLAAANYHNTSDPTSDLCQGRYEKIIRSSRESDPFGISRYQANGFFKVHTLRPTF